MWKIGCVCGFCRMGLFTSLLLFSLVLSMYVCDCLLVLLSVMGRQLDRESWYTVKDSVTCQTWYSRPGSCLLCFLLFSVYCFCIRLFCLFNFTGPFGLLTSALTFKKPFCMEKNSTFASGLLVFLTFAVTFKKPFVPRKGFNFCRNF